MCVECVFLNQTTEERTTKKTNVNKLDFLTETFDTFRSIPLFS